VSLDQNLIRVVWFSDGEQLEAPRVLTNQIRFESDSSPRLTLFWHGNPMTNVAIKANQNRDRGRGREPGQNREPAEYDRVRKMLRKFMMCVNFEVV
tara:strand:- start:19232 stop:19519 length:288 start_codon:yes stop_codon:yes gene_type:complete